MKKLLSHFGDSRTEESQSAVLDLLEKVTRLNKQLELKENQARRPEMNTEDQVFQATNSLALKVLPMPCFVFLL